MLVYTVSLFFQSLVPSAGYHLTVALGQFEMVALLLFRAHVLPPLSWLGQARWFSGHLLLPPCMHPPPLVMVGWLDCTFPPPLVVA